ncbi:MAG: CheR family methyltransferase [Brevinema sp.]
MEFHSSQLTLSTLATMIKEESGIFFPDGHLKVLDQRIVTILREKQCSEEQLVIRLQNNHQEFLEFIGHVTTNHTFFFRSLEQFISLENHILPELIIKNKEIKHISIWSAACSTGEEPYTIAMCVKEFLDNRHMSDWTFNIIATDIKEQALDIAKTGKYKFNDLKHIPIQYKHLINIVEDASDISGFSNYIEMTNSLKDKIHFESHNLIKQKIMPSVDIIFCRNVLIYFDIKTQEQVISNLTRVLKPNRYLFISPTESLSSLKTDLKSHILPKCIFYEN